MRSDEARPALGARLAGAWEQARGGWGRQLGAAALLVAVLAQAASLGLSRDAPRRLLFDAYARLWPRVRTGDPAIVVTVDEDSLAKVGQWPWPRTLIADLVGRVLKDKPAALGFDILMPEPDRLSPAAWAAAERALPAELRERLATAPDHDRTLAATIADNPVVLAVSGQNEGRTQPGPLTPVRVFGGDPTPFLPSHSVLIHSIPVLEAGAAGHGLLSVEPDPDGAVRRVSLVERVAGQLVPSLTTEMLRLAADSPSVDVHVGAGGVESVDVGELSIPTQADGTVWVHLSPSLEARFLSAGDVLAGRVPDGTFESKLVILAVTGLGLIDLSQTALGAMYGSEVQAQFLENVIEGRLASRPRWAPAAELALTLVLGAALVALLPRRPLWWYGAAAAAVLAVAAALGFGAWAGRLWLVDVGLPAAACVASLAAMVGGDLIEATAQRRQLRRDLEAQRLAAARVAGELEAAQRIQLSILPKPEEFVPDPRVEIGAVMTPAKQVGGDLYDFFKIDDDRLFVTVGDVSGKGVPASLFMALGKSLCKSCVLRGDADIGTIITTANTEIARDNAEMLFITLVGGVLNLDTGEFRFCNAGHDMPYVVLPGDPPRQVEGDSGPPLCVMEDFPYGEESYQLNPGDILCMVTDGVTEAQDGAGTLYGAPRAAEALARLAPGSGAADLVRHLEADVDAFVGDADPADDLTIVAVRWNGPAGEPASGLPASFPEEAP